METKIIKEKELWQWKVMEYLSYFLVFIIPLYFNNRYHLFAFGSQKEILMIGIILFMTILFSWGIGIEKRLTFRITPLHIISLIFISILTLSSILGIDPLNSFFGRWREGISLILIYALTLFAFLIGFLVKKNKSFLSRILLSSFISSLFVLIFSYTNILGIEILERGATTLGNNSYAGAYLLFNACFGIGLFFYYSKIWQKIFIALGTLIIGFSPVFFNHDILLGKIGVSAIFHKPFLLLGTANAATMGLAVSFGIIISLFFIFSSKKVAKIIGLVIFIAILFGIIFASCQLVKPTSSLHRVYVEQKGGNRFISWNIAQTSFGEHPFLGSGFNNFSYNYQKYFTSDILKEKNIEFYFNQPHNIILEYASNNGLLGLMSFLGLLLFAFLALFQYKENEEKKNQRIKIALIGALFGYFIQNLFGFDTPAIYLMLFLLIGIATGESKKEWVYAVPGKRNNWFKFISGLVLISSLVAMVLFVILPIKEFRRWGKVGSANDIKERILLRDGMQDISLLGGVSDSVYVESKFFEYYKKNMDKINNSNKSIYLEELQAMINQMEKGIKKQPYNDRPYVLSNQLFNMGMYINNNIDEYVWNKSYDNIKKALLLNPQNSETYILLAQTYLSKKDFSNTRLSIRQAIEIAPEYIKSYEYARMFLKMKPDTDFQKYIDNMEKRWISPTIIN